MGTTNSFDKRDVMKCFLCGRWTPTEFLLDQVIEGEPELICVTCMQDLDRRREQLEIEMEVYKQAKEANRDEHYEETVRESNEVFLSSGNERFEGCSDSSEEEQSDTFEFSPGTD